MDFSPSSFQGTPAQWLQLDMVLIVDESEELQESSQTAAACAVSEMEMLQSESLPDFHQRSCHQNIVFLFIHSFVPLRVVRNTPKHGSFSPWNQNNELMVKHSFYITHWSIVNINILIGAVLTLVFGQFWSIPIDQYFHPWLGVPKNIGFTTYIDLCQKSLYLFLQMVMLLSSIRTCMLLLLSFMPFILSEIFNVFRGKISLFKWMT